MRRLPPKPSMYLQEMKLLISTIMRLNWTLNFLNIQVCNIDFLYAREATQTRTVEVVPN